MARPVRLIAQHPFREARRLLEPDAIGILSTGAESDRRNKENNLRVFLFVAALAQPVAGPSDRPAPRPDANSQTAHRELLEKARSGRIDVYFVGDSITRRWGALDYPEFLAHWRENFSGWNAANFGWGGDRTEHILWRLEDGELDGVDPKIIVVQAGANNVGREPGGESKVADVTRGIKAIVDRCRAKAPRATIVLTAIFPRNDSLAVLPEINAINRSIATLADGRQVRYLDVNDKLADSDGRIFDGMMVDGLHPTIRGYQVWADGLKPIFTEILGPPASIDLGPPPTGDPSVRKPPSTRKSAGDLPLEPGA